MSQHFLPSSRAKTLTLASVARLSDEEAEAVFRKIRWAGNGGNPFCSKCGCTIVYDCRRANGTARWRCKACRHSFSITSGKATIVHADESTAWNPLHGRFVLKRINHQEAYSLNDACVNDAESFFAPMRRAEIGHHHYIAGSYLIRFAQECAWREDHRRDSNGSQVDRVVALVMKNKPSVDFCGYWQRSWATA